MLDSQKFVIQCLLPGFLLALSGCQTTHKNNHQAPLVAGNDTFLNGIAGKRPEISPSPWWRSLRAPELNELIADALESNLTTQQFASRVKQADARKRKTGAALFPTLEIGADTARQDTHRLNESALASRERSSSIGILLDWEADIWGKLSAATQAAELDVDAARYDWLGAQLLLSSSVSETYLEIIEQRQLLDLLNDQVEVNETLAKLTELRYGQGQASIVDILQQREQLEATRSLFPDTEAQLKDLDYALAVLLGRAPQTETIVKSTEFPDPSRLRSNGTPSALLKERPDLLAASARIGAIDHRVAEAVADRLPQFSLRASLTASGVPSLESLVSNLVGEALIPIIDGGERKAEIELRKAQLEEAIQSYSELYLEAIREVETALFRESKQAERVSLLEDQLKTAQKLLSETRNRYSNGLTDYLPVLAAIQSVQRLERALISNKRIHLSYRVAIHRALGGQ